MSAVRTVLICLSLSFGSAMENYKLFQRVVKGCLEGHAFVSCLANRTERMVDRFIDKDVPLFDGMIFKRNDEVVHSKEARNLRDSILKFLDSHTLTLDFNEPREGDKGGYGGFAKVDKKDRKYLYYALTAVAGIFGLSVPLVLKGLAILAGKALLASKAALIIIGSVALKKIFQAEKEPVNVHTHTVTVDDHDRIATMNEYPYHSYVQH